MHMQNKGVKNNNNKKKYFKSENIEVQAMLE